MRSRTKNIFIASILVTLFSAGVCSFLVYEIEVKGMLLEEKLKILAENNNKEKSYIDIQRTIRDTEVDRNKISDKFFSSEDDSITFLNEIEALAPKLGLVLETQALEPIFDENKKLQSIKISFNYSGKKASVMDFSKILENLQYYSYLENLNLKKVAQDDWNGKVTLVISIYPS